MKSAPAVAALAAIAAWVWLAMMLVHELGHVLAAWLTGGRITSLELRPGWLSHTLVQPNPHPSVVVWSGFLVGWIVPQLTAPLWKTQRGLIGPVLRAWAAFCLLAGGSYLALAGGDRFTDTGLLASEGWPLGLLSAVGIAVAVVGYQRSRTAWTEIAKRVEACPILWSHAAGWWLFVASWVGFQWCLHASLSD